MSMHDQGGYVSGDVPPVIPGELGGLGERAKWPTVLGWFSIVLGALGILKNGCGAASNLVMGGAGMTAFMGGGSGPQAAQAEQMKQAMGGLSGWIMLTGALSLVSLFVSVLLLVAGISMLNRKVSSVGMHKAWAWVRIGMLIAETGVGLVLQTAMVNAMMTSMPQGGGGTPPPAGFSQMIMAFTVIGVCFSVLLGLAYPVTVLIVLGKRWAKEEVSRWGDGGAAKMEW